MRKENQVELEQVVCLVAREILETLVPQVYLVDLVLEDQLELLVPRVILEIRVLRDVKVLKETVVLVDKLASLVAKVCLDVTVPLELKVTSVPKASEVYLVFLELLAQLAGLDLKDRLENEEYRVSLAQSA